MEKGVCMSLNSTPSSERIHIGFFGKRNAGKSSLINAITNQELAIVSDVKGTTTDPVYKAMELLPLGPISVIDTAGYDDDGELGKLRIEKTKQVLNKVDIAILVIDSLVGIQNEDKDFISLFEQKDINSLLALFSIGGEEIFILTYSSVKSTTLLNEEFGTNFTEKITPLSFCVRKL